MEISRFPCKRLLRMPGSTTTRGRHVSCDIVTCHVAFCGTENISTADLSYAAQYLAYALPCERFTSALADIPCFTRGRCGSLLLHRDGLPPSTFCRSPGAPVHSINSGHEGGWIGPAEMGSSPSPHELQRLKFNLTDLAPTASIVACFTTLITCENRQ